MRSHILNLSLQALLIGLLSANASARQTHPAQPLVRVHGVVLDRESRRAVPGAEVRLTRRSDDSAAVHSGDLRVTDDAGRFAFERVEPGAYQLRVARFGYRPLDRALDVRPGVQTGVTAEITSLAVDLEPVLVTATRPLSSTGSAYVPGGTSPFGHRIGRDEIEARRDPRLSDLLRSVAGVRILRADAFDQDSVTFRSGCSPALFLDGLETLSIETLDRTITPADLDAIEVFRGAETPVAYRRNTCGAILLWSRGRALPEGGGPFWLRALAGAAFFATAFLLLR